jgi:tryptophan synthase beta subunit
MSAGFAEYAEPADRGYFGQYGATFVPETLVTPLSRLKEEYLCAKADPDFARELRVLLKGFAGRSIPTVFRRGIECQAPSPRASILSERTFFALEPIK